MKPNAEKCHLIICDKNNASVNLNNNLIKSESSVKLLGITIDNRLKFTEHVSTICKRANQKLHALARISSYMNQNKLRILMKAFVTSQFSYCPLVWMFHSRSLNNKINRLHERALRLVYRDHKSSFQQLLHKDNSVTIHHQNIQRLAIEMFKIKNKISPTPMQDLFTKNQCNYELRNKRLWEPTNARTMTYGTETVTFMGPKIWDLIPTEIKKANSLTTFKSKIKQWKPYGCPCKLCKVFIPQLGYL